MKVASNVQRVGQMPLNTSLREALKLLSIPKEKPVSRPEPERELLIEAKGWTEWGDWYGWIRDNCKFSRQTADNYIKVAVNRQRASELPKDTSIREALKLLSKPKEKSTSRPEPERELAFSCRKKNLRKCCRG